MHEDFATMTPAALVTHAAWAFRAVEDTLDRASAVAEAARCMVAARTDPDLAVERLFETIELDCDEGAARRAIGEALSELQRRLVEAPGEESMPGRARSAAASSTVAIDRVTVPRADVAGCVAQLGHLAGLVDCIRASADDPENPPSGGSLALALEGVERLANEIRRRLDAAVHGEHTAS